MGSEQFKVKVSAKSAHEAFKAAVNHYQYDRGHGGYTGTIAEKSEFRMEVPQDGESPNECVERCMHDSEHFSDSKWGPAGCVDLGPNPKNPEENLFCFFGWASS